MIKRAPQEGCLAIALSSTHFLAAGYLANVAAAVDRPSRIVRGISGPGYTTAAYWPWLGAALVFHATVLCCMAHKWEWLCPALDLGGDGAHALGGGRTHTTAVIPSRTIAWRTSFGAILS